MFASSMPVVLKARQTEKADELNPIIFSAIIGNCTSWIAYSYVLSNYFVFAANWPGIVMGMFYFLSAFALRRDQRATAEKLLVFFVGLLSFLGILTVGACKTLEAKKVPDFTLCSAR